MLRKGNTAWPIIIWKSAKTFDFASCEVREGNHKAVAFHELALPRFPFL